MKNIAFILKGLFKNNKPNAKFFYNRGNAKSSIEDYPGSVSDYSEAIKINPKYAEAYYRRFLALKEWSLGWHLQFSEDHRTAVQLNSKFAKVDTASNSIKNDYDDFHGAISYYSKKIEINPRDYELHYFRGYAKEFLGQSQNALEDYNKAIEINPKYAKPYFRRGILITSNREKITEFSKFIELDPNNAKGYYCRGAQKALLLIDQIKDQLKNGQIVILTEDFDDELSDFNYAIKLNPKYDEAYYLRGHVYARMGNRRSAYYDFEKAAELGNSMAKSEIVLNYLDIKKKIDIMDTW